MPMQKIQSVNLDANESAFFSRQLEFIKARSFDVLYPEFPATRLIPVVSDAGPGAQSITYRQYDAVGLMKFIANYADDLPRSDVKGKEFTRPVRSIGGSYGYSVQDIRSAQMTGLPLEQRKANATRQAYEQKVNDIAFFADGSDAYGGLYGLLYHPNVTSGAVTIGAWDTATPDEIITDVNTVINGVRSITKGVEIVDTVLMALSAYTLIATRPRSSTTDTTILEFLRRVHPGVTFEPVNELEAVDPKPSGGAGPIRCLVAYRRNPDKLTLEIPQMYETFPAQERNLEFVVPCHARVAGVICYYPLGVSIGEGI